jgi:cardiolipin synthase
LGLVPVFVVVATQEADLGMRAGWSRPAVWIVAAAGVSDVLDGFLARRWALTTRFGALLDAVADKSFQFTTLVTITALGRPLFSQLPLWLLGAVVVRDLVLLAGWLTMRRLKRPVDVEHELHGRVATVLVFGLVVGATLGWAESALVPAAALAALAALLSAAAYIRRGVEVARGALESGEARDP